MSEPSLLAKALEFGDHLGKGDNFDLTSKKSSKMNDTGNTTDDMQEATDKLQGLSLAPARNSFQPSVKCYDLAVVGRYLVLAVGSHGMKEYDSSAGKELGGWKPPKTSAGKNEWVCALDAFTDGRVAVCLDESKCIVVLQKTADQTWLEVKRIGIKQSPYHVAVHGDLVAATADGVATSQVWVPGMAGAHTLDPGSLLHVESVDADSGRPVLHITLDYKVFNLTLTDKVVIVLSLEKQALADGNHKFVADAYSHRATRLWRYTSADQMNDVSAAPSGSIIYVALRGAKRVMAIRGSDGQSLGDVLSSSSHALAEPIALSLGTSEAQALLAVLFADWRTIMLYPVTNGCP